MNHNLAFVGLALWIAFISTAQAVCSQSQATFIGASTSTWTNPNGVSTPGVSDSSSTGISSGVITIDFNSPITLISGIAVTINRKCSANDSCQDVEVSIDGGSSNKANAAFWISEYETKVYGDCNDMWGISNIPSIFSVRINASANSSMTFSIDYVNLTVYFTELTSGPVTTQTVSTGRITTGAPPVTTDASQVTTATQTVTTRGASQTTTANAGAATSSRSTTGRSTSGVVAGTQSVTSSQPSPLTTGENDTANVLTSNVSDSKSDDGFDFQLLYIILGSVIGALFIAIVVLLGVYARKRSRSQSPEIDEERSSTAQELPVVEKKELPEPDEKELIVPMKKMGEKIEKLKKPVDFPNANGYDVEFNYIEKKTMHLPATENYTSASLPINAAKNRFRNVLPPEETRVKLTAVTGIDGSDYINANYIKGLIPGSEKAYIATQGPLASTINDFWKMVWEQNTVVILNLTREFENGRLKSERYWPENEEPFDTPDFEIKLSAIKESEGLIERKLGLTRKETKESREITQFHYIGWPDHGIPTHTDAYIQLAEGADTANSTNAPIVVHCSAGIGRTGTFVTIHSILELVKKHLKENPGKDLDINIPQMVMSLRNQRTGMVQTPEQFEFTYKAIYDGIQFQLHPEMKPPAPPLEEISTKEKEKEKEDDGKEEHSPKNSPPNSENEKRKKKKKKEGAKSNEERLSKELKEESLSILKSSQSPSQEVDIATSVEPKQETAKEPEKEKEKEEKSPETKRKKKDKKRHT